MTPTTGMVIAAFEAAGALSDLDLTNVILILGVVGIAITKIGEGRGWFKTAATLRVENTDLLRRNTELENTIVRHETTIQQQGEKIVRLEEQVRALEKLDQSAVLSALKEHRDDLKALLTRIAESLEAQPQPAPLERIANSLEQTTTEGGTA